MLASCNSVRGGIRSKTCLGIPGGSTSITDVLSSCTLQLWALLVGRLLYIRHRDVVGTVCLDLDRSLPQGGKHLGFRRSLHALCMHTRNTSVRNIGTVYATKMCRCTLYARNVNA
jgi:hypothetical protein